MTTYTDDNLNDDVVNAATSILRRRIDELERAKEDQPVKLAAAREAAAEARAKCLAEEPWSECWSALPMTDMETGELSGMMALPSIAGKELWGTRIGLDFLDTDGDEDKVKDVLDRCFCALDRNPEHLMIVFAAALSFIGEWMFPQVLALLEEQGSNYTARVIVADAARNAWATRLNDGLGTNSD